MGRGPGRRQPRTARPQSSRTARSARMHQGRTERPPPVSSGYMSARSSAAPPGRENQGPRWARPSSARLGSGRPEPSTQHSLRKDHEPSRSLRSPQDLGCALPKRPVASLRGHARRAGQTEIPTLETTPAGGGELRSRILKSGQPVGRGGFPGSFIDTAALDVRRAQWLVRGPHPNRNPPTKTWALGPSRCTDSGL